MKFSELGLDEQIIESISYMGFEDATPVQELAIPSILDGRDMIACAQTGTGKTAAFMLPILNDIAVHDGPGTKTLVLVPTRELAIQIDKQVQGFGYFLGVSSLAVIGGGSGGDFEQEKKAMTQGADIIIATPGRLIAHLNLGYVKFKDVRHLVLDEADRMLDMGFLGDIKKIASFLPDNRQNLMFSATMPTKIKKLARTLLDDPVEIALAISKPAEGVLQAAYVVHESQKVAVISDLIAEKPDYQSIIIFSSTKRKVKDIVNGLRMRGIPSEAISSDLEQKDREDVLRRFANRKTKIVVATDVLSRGIDIKDINLVINYDCPGDAEDYVHRIGRTARADSTGVALTMISPDDMRKFASIEELIDMEVHKVPIDPKYGDAPKWDPNYRPKRNFGGRRQGSNRKGKSSKNYKGNNRRRH